MVKEYSLWEDEDRWIFASSDELKDTIYIGHDDQIAIVYFDEYLKDKIISSVNHYLE